MLGNLKYAHCVSFISEIGVQGKPDETLIFKIDEKFIICQ